MAETLLDVRNLSTAFVNGSKKVTVVDDVSFSVAPGRTLAIVGESGCGKSILSLSMIRLVPDTARTVGQILMDGEDLAAVSPQRMRQIRGGKIGMIFQEPMTSLNPIMTVGAQLSEALKLHVPELNAAERHERAVEGLRRVRLPAPEAQFHRYPHELSGGMRQRVMIAMALSCEPELLIADEPTTALDVTVQAEILALLGDLQRDTGMAVILITHDLGVVAEFADEVMVMYAGRIVERGTVGEILSDPQHPYTIGLMGSIPRFGSDDRLLAIEGTVPALSAMPPGCRFAPRCVFAVPRCAGESPVLREVTAGHAVSCHFAPLEDNL
ncbi:ABC transporter ATP-binding protein [Hoeflea alexandrii]|uniref:ABC transporter ATP-binding protein n=1 Tax=Hoeflea alexandrii TaxID=288436 RepID=UPI0022AF6EF6|nr:ABC transporter ATP-binding protein [Hoeflea alexandrii]MCZ4291984.1 ABC transporter ATP-binding protein [Hoeflea alexandrii]